LWGEVLPVAFLEKKDGVMMEYFGRSVKTFRLSTSVDNYLLCTSAKYGPSSSN